MILSDQKSVNYEIFVYCKFSVSTILKIHRINNPVGFLSISNG
jgi:hypothetical protein